MAGRRRGFSPRRTRRIERHRCPETLYQAPEVAQGGDQDVDEGACPALEAPRCPDAGQSPHEEAEIEAGDVHQQALLGGRRPHTGDEHCPRPARARLDRRLHARLPARPRALCSKGAGFEPPTGDGAFIADRAEVDLGFYKSRPKPESTDLHLLRNPRRKTPAPTSRTLEIVSCVTTRASVPSSRVLWQGRH